MPRILVTQAGRLIRGPDGHVYAPTSTLAWSFWTRYLSVFDHVSVACRVTKSDSVPESMPRADGEGVTFHDIPSFVGPWQYLTARSKVIRALRRSLKGYNAYCLRVPCWVGTLAYHQLRRRGLPYGVEVVGDPWGSLARGAVKSLIRPIARRSAHHALQRQCQDACAATYVTREALQSRYPAGANAYSVHCSDVELDEQTYVETARTDYSDTFRLIFVGTLEVLYKGQDVLIRALARCGRDDIHLTLIGDGRCRAELEALASSLGLTPRITFAGTLAAGQQVRDALDQADLFVLPSHQEGLPRAMIEAMARGLPCIGSAVGGIPELLAPEDLFEPGDVEGLARKITEFIGDAERLARAAKRNLQTAREYHADNLIARRREFFEELLRRNQQASAEMTVCRV